MKTVELRTKEVVDAYNMLGEAKYQKLSDEDKVKVWKISRKLSQIAKRYLEDVEDAKKKMQPDEEFQRRMEAAEEYEKLTKEGIKELPISETEYREAVDEFRKYIKLLNKALKEFADKTVSIEIDTLQDASFGKLMSSNDWTLGQVECLEFILE